MDTANDSLASRVEAVRQAASAEELLAATRALALSDHGGRVEESAIACLVEVLGFNNPGAAVAAVEGLIRLGPSAIDPLLSRLDPTATTHRLIDHRLTSRTSEAVDIDDPAALPDDLVATTTTRTPDKTSIKARIRAAIAAATAGLPAPEAAHLAFSIAATAVPGARLTKRRHWSIT